jgi:hypothetical protein
MLRAHAFYLSLQGSRAAAIAAPRPTIRR